MGFGWIQVRFNMHRSQACMQIKVYSYGHQAFHTMQHYTADATVFRACVALQLTLTRTIAGRGPSLHHQCALASFRPASGIQLQLWLHVAS